MQFLRTVFWVVIAVLAVIFAFNNWVAVTVHLWSDIEAEFKLPILLLAVFLLGLLPPWILHRVTRWSLRRKLETANRNLIETRGLNEVTAVHHHDGVVTDTVLSPTLSTPDTALAPITPPRL